MSDAQFRLLIQRSFDEELSKQENRALLDHLDSSESGQKFHHQLDQMIQAAQDMPLPDELKPQNPEALARMIMEQLPQKKGNIFGFLTGLFGGGGGGKPKQKAEPKNGKNKKDAAGDGGRRDAGKKDNAKAARGKGGFGKGKSQDFEEEQDNEEPAGKMPGIKFPRKAKELDQEEIETQAGGFSRLKSMGSRSQDQDNREAQSTTRSLGEKFSMPWAAQSGGDDGPLTLAESIKRKVTESQKLSPIDENELSGSHSDSYLSGASAGSQGGFAPPSQPSAFGRTDSGFAQSSFSQSTAQPPQPSQPSLDQPTSSSDGWSAPVAMPNKQPVRLDMGGGFSPGTGGGGGSAIGLSQPNAAAAPAANDWGGAAGWQGQAQGQTPAQAKEEPKTDWGSGWNAPTDQKQPLKSSDSWAMPGAEGGQSWEAARSSASHNALPAQSQANATSSAAANAGQNAAGVDPWGSAPTTNSGANGSSGAGWSQQPASSPPAWNAAPAPASPAMASSASGWEAASPAPSPQVNAGLTSSSGWDSTPAPQTGVGWDAPAASAPAQTAASSNTGWDAVSAAQPTASANSGWDASPTPSAAVPNAAWDASPAVASPAAPSPNSGWDASPTPAASANSGQAGWGQTGATPSGWGQTDSWTAAQPSSTPQTAPAPQAMQPVQATPAPAADPWAQAAPAPAPADAWAQAAPTSAPQQSSAPTNDPWAVSPQAVAAPAPQATQPATGGWAPQPAEAKQASKRSWATAEPDLIETGTFRAFTPSMDNSLGAKAPPRPQTGQQANPFANTQVGGVPLGVNTPAGGQQSAPVDNRFDVPISERIKQQAPIQQEAQQAAQDNRFDIPISERMKMQQDGSQIKSVQENTPIAPVQNQSNIPVNQIVDKMGEVLAGGQAQAKQDDRWELPIADRKKMQQSGGDTGGFGETQPTQSAQTGWQSSAPVAPGWNQQPQAQNEVQSGWGVPAQPQAQPTAEAQSPWGNTQAQPAPQAQAVESSPWGNTQAQPAPQAQAVESSPWGNTQAQPAPQAQAVESSPWGNTQAQSAPQAQAVESSPWGNTQAQPAPAAWAQPSAVAPPAMPAPAAPAVSSAPSEITDKGKAGGLFNLDNNAIDKIFDGIGVTESVSQTVVNSGGTNEQPQASGWGNQSNAPAAPAAFAPVSSQPAAPAASPWAAAAPAPAPNPAMQAQMQAPNPVAASQPNLSNQTNQSKGLFQLDDQAVDQIFGNIGVEEKSVPISKSQEMSAPATGFAQPPAQNMAQPAQSGWNQPAATAAAPAQTAQGGWPQAQATPGGWAQPPAQGMFQADANVMNKVFPEAQPQAPAQPVIHEIRPAPKIEGIGRLDANSDNSQDTGSGRIAAIGKFLLDQKDLDKIGKLAQSDMAEGKLRVLTMEASQDLQELLGQIGKQQGVIGSVIVGHDGLLIANTMPSDMDAESVGVWALGVYMNTEHVTKKMGHDRVHQVVSRTPRGYVVIADFGGGLLVTVTDGNETDQLIPLMRTITLLVN
ncbi:MAG: roadblock/LC7 domain-containing protein [Candidatus Obscuribacterales bacterium]|nr:roadblock/LC7 domain-containing protein [Candidatus Obscuribacterales bacterium]